jgi:hypothetical protein
MGLWTSHSNSRSAMASTAFLAHEIGHVAWPAIGQGRPPHAGVFAVRVDPAEAAPAAFKNPIGCRRVASVVLVVILENLLVEKIVPRERS